MIQEIGTGYKRLQLKYNNKKWISYASQKMYEEAQKIFQNAR